MREIIANIIENYGSIVSVSGDSFRAFLQTVTTKSWQNMNREFGPLGEIPRGQYLYLGPVDRPVSSGDILTCHGEEYVVRRADTVLVGDEELYIWGLCVRKGADDPWSS